MSARSGGSVILLKDVKRSLLEGAHFDLGEVVRQRDLAQGRAPVEGGTSNLCEVGRQHDLAQGRALLEGVLSHLG